MNIMLNSQVQQEKWDMLLKRSPQSSPFQSLEFYELFNNTKGFSADVFALEEHDAYSAIFVVTVQKEKNIKSFFSRRGIIYGGPLLSSETKPEGIEKILQFINNYYRYKLIYIETRNLFDYSVFSHPFHTEKWKFTPYLNFQLECNDLELIKKSFNRRRRREIVIAEEEGTSICEAGNIEELNALYEIISELYMKKIKKPLLPLQFFQNFYETSLCKVIIVKFNEKIIGGVICAILKDKAVYGWYGAGLDKDFRKNSPVVMGIYGAIDYGVKNGFQYYDFMGAGKPDEKYGVKKFKEEFGGQLVNHGRFLIILNPILYKIGQKYISFKSSRR